MEVLTLNGVRYVKASKAAKDLGYASDYVSQLCRSGNVDAHLVGRSWYVNPETLGAHRVEKKRNARVKAREYAHKSIQEARMLQVPKTKNTYKNVAIRYISDEKSLIPEVRKVSIVSEKKLVETNTDYDNVPSYELENKNKKIIMSGNITVIDVDAEPVITDTTILKPRIIKQKIAAKKSPETVEESEENHTDSRVDSSFSDRLHRMEEVPAESSAIEATEQPKERNNEVVRVDASNDHSYIYGGLLMAGLILLGVIALSLEKSFLYANGEVETYIYFNFDLSKYIEKI